VLAGALAFTTVAVRGTQQDAPADTDDLTPNVERQVEQTLRVFGDGGVRIGVSIRDVEPGAAVGGAEVEQVQDDSPAAKAGVQKGDVITQFDGERVRSARQLSRIVGETPAGRSVTVRLMRAGRQVDLQVTPEANQASGPFGRRMREMPGFRFELPDAAHGRFIPREGFPSGIGGRARLGVSIQGMSPQLAEYFGASKGVLVTSVREDSPAEQAGLKAGDVITSVNGKPVASPGDLTEAVRESGETAKITYVRDRKTADLDVVLPSRGEGGRVRPSRPA
jgi:serine protease Do